MARVFVVGAANPNGGTFMAYQLGHILHRHFGYQPFAVRVGNEAWDDTKHVYDEKFPLVSIRDMEERIGSADILVVNPSFSSHMFGLRLPGLKICYVQGFSTFSLLDARFDLYVSVSGFVRDFLANTYGIETRVVPPFLEPYDLKTPAPWRERPRGTILVYLKNPMARVFYQRLKEIVGPGVDLSNVVNGMSLPRHELMARIASCRYLLSLSPAEGFGLVPLEAMSVGTVVCGFDGFGGRQYFRSMENCAVSPYPDIEGVARQLAMLIEDDDLAEALSRRGREMAEQFSYEKFRDAWIGLLSDTVTRLEPQPVV